MKKSNIDKEKLKESLKNPRIRGLVFFGFYIIFFIVVFMMIGSNSNESLESVEEHETVDISYKFENINQMNYHFNYEIIENGNKIVYDGDKNLTKESFTVTKDQTIKEYFSNDNIYLVKNSSWDLSESPYIHSDFLDNKEINRLLKNSTFIAKTEYQNKDVVYQYEISTTTILSLIDEIEVDLMDEVNKINLHVKDDEVYKIELNLTPYFKYKDETNKELQISLEYSKFGEIEDLKTPVY